MSDQEEEDFEGGDRPRIRVTDRRLFDNEGNLRAPTSEADGEVAEDSVAPPLEAVQPEAPARTPEPEPEPDAAPASQADAEPPPPAPLPPEEATAEAPVADPELSGPDAGPGSLPRDFAGFIESQYYEALLYLGAIRHPATGEVVDDPTMAQFKIDMLTMLHAKTEGNRTPEESQMLDDMLHQLRMLFLQKSNVVKL